MPDPALPAIHLIDDQAERLANLARTLEHRQPALAHLIQREVARAEVHSRAGLPRGVVAIGSVVEFYDEIANATRTMQLVYPPDANVDAGRLSVLTPIGAGLIGLSEGQSIDWPDRDGRSRRLRIVKVTPLEVEPSR